jgi:hypothetical protein
MVKWVCGETGNMTGCKSLQVVVGIPHANSNTTIHRHRN